VVIEWAFQDTGDDVAGGVARAEGEEGGTGREALGRTVDDLPVAEVAAATEGDRSGADTSGWHGDPCAMGAVVGANGGPIKWAGVRGSGHHGSSVRAQRGAFEGGAAVG
jgi:hypothetical protein